MRAITGHIVEGDSANHQLTIEVTDTPGAGGANHRYEITGFDNDTNPSRFNSSGYSHSGARLVVMFQNGPIKEFGVNGVTQEALLAIVIDRLKSFQSGPFACESNQKALDYTMLALDFLKDRTRARIARGVEGTHQK